MLALLAWVPLFWLFYRYEGKPVARGLGRLLLVLRLGFALGVILLLAGLHFTITGWIPQRSKLAVLIDVSRSMSILEEGKARLTRVREILQGGRLLEKLEQKTGIMPQIFSFSDTVSPLARNDIASFSLIAAGNNTDLSKSVLEVTGTLGESNLLGAIVLTDGAHNQGDSPRTALGGMRTPLYFVGIGQAGVVKDLAVSLERPPSIGYLNSQIRLRGEIRAYRVATASVPIVVKENGTVLETLNVPLAQDRKQTPFSITIPCSKEGAFTYSISVPELEGELTLENNSTRFLLKVVKERLRVLVLADRPTWDITFLKAAVRSDPNAEWISWVRLKDDRWVRADQKTFAPPTPRPDLSNDLADIDVIVLAGFPEPQLRPHAAVIKEGLRAGRMGMLILPARKGYVAGG